MLRYLWSLLTWHGCLPVLMCSYILCDYICDVSRCCVLECNILCCVYVARYMYCTVLCGACVMLDMYYTIFCCAHVVLCMYCAALCGALRDMYTMHLYWVVQYSIIMLCICNNVYVLCCIMPCAV